MSLICDEILAAEKQEVIEVASERTFSIMKKEDTKEEFMKQDNKKQNERKIASADGVSKKQKSKHESESENEEESQA